MIGCRRLTLLRLFGAGGLVAALVAMGCQAENQHEPKLASSKGSPVGSQAARVEKGSPRAALLDGDSSHLPNHWIHNTFPGPGHKATMANEPWGPGEGSDRCEKINAFKASPLDPNFMLQLTDIGPLVYSTDGTHFIPADIPVRGGASVAFNPHDENVAYALVEAGGGAGNTSGLGGWWRTSDKGRSWHIMYSVPLGSFEPEGRALGYNPLVVDPSPQRKDHIYLASASRGLLRSRDDGATWEVAALEGTMVGTLAAAHVKGDRTVIYAVTHGPAPADPKTYNKVWQKRQEQIGALWRLDVFPDGKVATIRLHHANSRFYDVEAHPTVPDRGWLLRQQGSNHQLIPFERFGTLLGEPLHQGRRAYRGVMVNPSNPKHLMLSRAHDERRGLMYSSDGGSSWQGEERQVVAERLYPFTLDYGPANFEAGSSYYYQSNKRHKGSPDKETVTFVAGDPKAVRMQCCGWTRAFVQSNNYGESFKPFAVGATFKKPYQMAFGSSEKRLGLARAEYGVVLTQDGGLSWRGHTAYNDPTLLDIRENHKGGWTKQTVWGIGIKPDNDDVVVVTTASKPVLILRTENNGDSWERVGEFDFPSEQNVHGSFLYWPRQNPKRVYAGPMRSEDAGRSWKKLEWNVIAVSGSNPNLLVGTNYQSHAWLETPATLAASTDGGDTWQELGPIPQEQSYMGAVTGPGLGVRNVTSIGYIRRAVGVDPSEKHDPTKGGKLRILLAGRSGAYEYLAGDDGLAAGNWQLYNEGLHSLSEYAGVIEPVPHLSHVAFDPRPGKSHIVYAAADSNTGIWNRDLKNMLRPFGTPLRPIYRSTDGGKSWSSIIGDDYPGAPRYLDPTDLVVSPHTGYVYVQDYTGQYSLPPPN